MEYTEFLQQKEKSLIESGFEVQSVNTCLFPFQEYCVKWALKKGRAAIFADCGLGKTIIQLEWAHQVAKHTDDKVLILAPLAVVEQTKLEAAKFHIPLDRIDIINYEQLDNINTSEYVGVVLDESSILKSYDGVYKTKLIDLFQSTPYKLSCTATPSPNDTIELTNQTEFLSIMRSSEVLSKYFVHDGGVGAVKYRLKKHSVKAFWRWVSSWALMIHKPSDIGFSNEGYDLPQLNFIEKQIVTENRKGNRLFNEVAVSATNFNEELRLTKIERLSHVVELVNSKPDESFIIWVKQNEEGEYLRKLLPNAIEVKGSDSPEYKKDKLLGFAQDKFPLLITKSKIASFGLNYQNCHNQIFASLDFSFEALYQSIRRSYRFGQTKPVNIYLITTDTMQNVIKSINEKQKQFNIMQEQMQQAMNESFEYDLKIKTDDVRHEEIKNGNFHIQRGDCCQLIRGLADKSVGFSIFSPPFVDLFTYSDHLEDMGNSSDYKQFEQHFKNYLVPELYRVMQDGRNVAVHCMDLPIQKGKEGYIGLRDFSGLIIKSFEDNGFIYHCRVTIWKNPVTEMQRTKALGLLHKQIKKDAVMSRVGIPDYILVFRKEGENLNPIKHQDTDNSKPDYLPVDLWQKYASPVWYDIDYSNTLNYKSGRDEKDEKHICPLQLPTIERCLHLWSNEGDTVLTPFMGIGSEVYQSVKMNRYGIGFELKKTYFDLALKNCNEAVKKNNIVGLFNNNFTPDKPATHKQPFDSTESFNNNH